MFIVKVIALVLGGGLLLAGVVLAAIIGFCAIVVNPRTNAPTQYAESRFLSNPPPLIEQELTLKIVTFNIADAYLFTSNRKERMKAIGELLTELDPDIVGIQESFIADDREVLLQALSKSRLRYWVIYPAATVGNGLLTLSAYPIVEHYFHRYQKNNAWYKLHQGDWWAGKGVGLARIELPCGGHIDFYNTHAQAGRGDESNRQVRFVQMGELAAFVNQSRSSTAAVVVVGDFNTKLGRPDLQRAMEEATLKLAVSIDTGIDLIFVADHPQYTFETLETVPIEGQTQGSTAAIFLSRAPTPRELWRIVCGPGEVTALSDHRGFMSTIRIVPRGIEAQQYT